MAGDKLFAAGMALLAMEAACKVVLRGKPGFGSLVRFSAKQQIERKISEKVTKSERVVIILKFVLKYFLSGSNLAQNNLKKGGFRGIIY